MIDSLLGAFGVLGSAMIEFLEKGTLPMNALHQLRADAKMTWIQDEHGWFAAPEDIVGNKSTGAVASTIWVERPSRAGTVVFITIDGESLDRAS
jgi:hypothetical protein